jgi:hypothetical protein
MLSGGATGAEQATPVRRRCCYDEAVREALVLLWGPGSDLRQAIEAVDSDSGRVDGVPWSSPPDAPVRERLLTASAATIDRLSTEVRADALGGALRTARSSPSYLRAKVRCPSRSADGAWRGVRIRHPASSLTPWCCPVAKIGGCSDHRRR